MNEPEQPNSAEPKEPSVSSEPAPAPRTGKSRPLWRRALSWAAQLAFLAVVYWALTRWQTSDLLPNGGPAPEFNARTLDGQPVSLAQLRGKKVVLHFWATWCGVCRQEFGSMRDFNRNRSADTVFLSVVDAEGEDPATLRAFAKEHGLDYPIVLGHRELLRSYKIKAFPTSYVIGSDGTLRDVTVGFTSAWSLGARVGCTR